MLCNKERQVTANLPKWNFSGLVTSSTADNKTIFIYPLISFLLRKDESYVYRGKNWKDVDEKKVGTKEENFHVEISEILPFFGYKQKITQKEALLKNETKILRNLYN